MVSCDSHPCPRSKCQPLMRSEVTSRSRTSSAPSAHSRPSIPKVRPIHHWLEDRVRAHIFLCMLAYYVEWHLLDAWRPILSRCWSVVAL